MSTVLALCTRFPLVEELHLGRVSSSIQGPIVYSHHHHNYARSLDCFTVLHQ